MTQLNDLCKDYTHGRFVDRDGDVCMYRSIITVNGERIADISTPMNPGLDYEQIVKIVHNSDRNAEEIAVATLTNKE